MGVLGLTTADLGLLCRASFEELVLDEGGGLRWNRLENLTREFHCRMDASLVEMSVLGLTTADLGLMCRASFEELVLDEGGGLRWNRLENLMEESSKSVDYDPSQLWLLAGICSEQMLAVGLTHAT